MSNNRGNDKNSRFEKTKKEFREELLGIDRVTRVTAGGRQLRFRAIMTIGDGKGKVALGTGKSWEVVDAIAKATADAKKRLIEVRIEDGTVPYDIKIKYKSAKIMVHPASKGTGIIAGGAMRKVLMVAGYKDVLAKRYGSSNLINNAKATIKAISSFKDDKNNPFYSKVSNSKSPQTNTPSSQNLHPEPLIPLPNPPLTGEGVGQRPLPNPPLTGEGVGQKEVKGSVEQKLVEKKEIKKSSAKNPIKKPLTKKSTTTKKTGVVATPPLPKGEGAGGGGLSKRKAGVGKSSSKKAPNSKKEKPISKSNENK